jgi:hypothetical protein
LAVATAILTALHEQLQKAKDPLDVLSQGGRAPRAPPPWTSGPV